MGGLSFAQLLIIALVVVLLFGTKKLRGIGSDLGAALKGFKKAMSEEDKEAERKNESVDHKENSSEQESTTSSQKEKQHR